jgi:hypothetical protein
VAGSSRSPCRKSSSMNFAYASKLKIWWSMKPRAGVGRDHEPRAHASRSRSGRPPGGRRGRRSRPSRPRSERSRSSPTSGLRMTAFTSPRHPGLAGADARGRMLAHLVVWDHPRDGGQSSRASRPRRSDSRT